MQSVHIRRKSKKRIRKYSLRPYVVTVLVACTVALTGTLTYDDRAHAVLDTATEDFRFLGDQVFGIDITAPRQNLFSLIRDIDHVVEIVDHATVHKSWMLGLTNFITRGRMHTVADALSWFDVSLTTRQAMSIGLCKPLAQLRDGESIVVQPDPFQQGVASWYGPGFQGWLAASGEIYNMYDRTAAHKTLPLQSLVRVVSQRSGESVIVRINDRGPYRGGRIIDLSRRAMDLIGGEDLAAVYLERIDPNALDVPCP